MSISILIVDDTEADARYLGTLLERMPGWELTVNICLSAEEIESRLAEIKPDIVFLDYSLGKRTGVDIIETARTAWPEIAFVLQTGNGNEAIAAAALRAGAADYLIKDDIDPESLNRCLRYVYGQLAMQREIRKHQDQLDQLVKERTAEVHRLSEAIEQSPFTIQIADIEGRIVYANSAFVSQWATTHDDVIGKKFDQFFSGVLSAEQLAGIHQAVSTGKVWRGQIRRNTKTVESWYRLAVSPVRDSDGVITHSVTLIGDISREIGLQKELQSRSNRLSTALAAEKMFSELQQQFIAMASHEFRTPLAIIDGAAQAMMRRIETMSPDQISDRLAKIRASVARMTDLLSSTLEMTSLDGQQADTTPEVCKLRSILRDLVDQVSENEPQARIDLDLDDLPSKISGDTRLISKIFSNLLLNAVRYSPVEPQISVRGRAEGNDVVISVSDNGIGIPPGEVSRVFDQFFRASNSSGTGGIGVGLYFAKKLTEMHGGSISVESVEGKGSTFTVRLPVDGTIGHSPLDAVTGDFLETEIQDQQPAAADGGETAAVMFGPTDRGGETNGNLNEDVPPQTGGGLGEVWKT